MKVVQVPQLQDNYSYLVFDESAHEPHAFVVDPAEPEKVIEAAKREKVQITTVLTTHHHWDHAGGNEKISELISGLTILGGDDRIPALTNKVKEGDTFNVGTLKIKVLFTPCHTAGHVLYLVDSGKAPLALFTGDTLFIGGCGRFFEGTAEQMHHALNEVIAKLPPNTEVYCGHEYTKKNLEFALHIEPNNEDVKKKLQWATHQSESNLSTVPSNVGEELLYNPFMRVEQPNVASAVGKAGEGAVAVMAALREAKNKF